MTLESLEVHLVVATVETTAVVRLVSKGKGALEIGRPALLRASAAAVCLSVCLSACRCLAGTVGRTVEAITRLLM